MTLLEGSRASTSINSLRQKPTVAHTICRRHGTLPRSADGCVTVNVQIVAITIRF